MTKPFFKASCREYNDEFDKIFVGMSTAFTEHLFWLPQESRSSSIPVHGKVS